MTDTPNAPTPTTPATAGQLREDPDWHRCRARQGGGPVGQPTVLDLFAGYGGFSLAFHVAGFRTLAFSEIDPYASAVLAHRFPSVPNLGDVRGVTRSSVLDRCGVLPTVVTGGFPCQPHSAAGKRLASADERDL